MLTIWLVELSMLNIAVVATRSGVTPTNQRSALVPSWPCASDALTVPVLPATLSAGFAAYRDWNCCAEVPPKWVSPLRTCRAVRATSGVICTEQGVRLKSIACPLASRIDVTEAGGQNLPSLASAA